MVIIYAKSGQLKSLNHRKSCDLYGWNALRGRSLSPGQRPKGPEVHISCTPCFTLIEQALSAFLTLIMFNEPWILSDVVYVIEFTFFHEGEYDS